ncbi:predicted protein [Lichtheimia corymbifera JMRC:FSU:9682]|uniref:Uncharacterized protein n=1 Tax=Lichtheimia corymbifera JMRC:FSU:9682 TaxID=1263082 RepID=A0A068S0G0_9FUNG|nr:predicted protein [Lichtheimia corymbifera JMRC:FSU:9682]
MKPEAHLPTHTNSNIARDMPMTPDSSSSRPGHLSVSESESGIEASLSSMGEEDDDDHQRHSQAMTDQDPPLLQRAMRSAKRSAAQTHHKPLHGGFARRTDDDSSMAVSQQPQTSDLDSLPREEQDMVMAGVANATMGADPVVISTSSSSSIDSIQGIDEQQQQQSQHYPMQPQPRNIPTPSSGYDGDSEGTTADTNRPPLSSRSMEHHLRHHHHHHHHHHPSTLPSKHQMTD